MIIEQFYDKGLAHASYAIISDRKMAVIDPGRNPYVYYDFAEKNEAKIVAVIETHPHADFVSSHAEIAQTTGAPIYVGKLLGAEYAHITFDDGDVIALGNLSLHAMNTPGHSPDSICILLKDEAGDDHALFSGDTLFIGDVGRPDLRESVGNIHAKREELARAMYKSVEERLKPLADHVIVYPAHGAGSLCGKNLSSDLSSTIGREKRTNYAFLLPDEASFVAALLDGQPFVPKYFGYDVMLNKKGAPAYETSINAVPRGAFSPAALEKGLPVIDARPENIFKAGHFPGALNLQNGGKFETWLGSVVGGDERFYLIAADAGTLEELIIKSSKIGYEALIAGAFVAATHESFTAISPAVDVAAFTANQEAYHILDIRNNGERADGAYFANSQHIPLPELRERAAEVPTDKPIMVHCAAGYRSAAGSSILEAHFGNAATIFDLSEAINSFK